VASGEQPVFAIRPTNSQRVTPSRYGNLRNLSDQSIDSSLIRNVRIPREMESSVARGCVQYVQPPGVLRQSQPDPTNVNFGKILRDSGQSNAPRVIQLGARFLF
jgi:hypothetical protein